MNKIWFLYEWDVVLIRLGCGSYMSTKPLVGAAPHDKNKLGMSYAKLRPVIEKLIIPKLGLLCFRIPKVCVDGW